MKLCIMRHGDAANGPDDAARPLSAKGEAEAKNAGRFLAGIGEIPDVVLHSPLLRSRQTAEGVVRAAGLSRQLRVCDGIAPCDDPEAFAHNVRAIAQEGRVLVVTHQPFVSALASFLLSDGEGLSMKFTTGTVAGFERSASFGLWTLRFHVTARAIARL
jgi:phosphohistidine phosphatase